ncbi:hypothetical protein E4665_06825 [Sporolactobacillus shoreae]|uniref:Replication protein n=1 Tax=Sporolactobacillus shoreae TaxID=1465501 RepID=A0A4Z0GRG2_9BACL|nr:hypothetical protein [Sporolactobacillus shoreae]TGA99026.1 hypothetical protein E4665_06825 [Sporolactobacillus shoreae]
MNLMSVISGKGFVMFNKEIARSVSVNGAIIFGQLCSSYESFEKKNMLTNKDGKEYFFLTSESIEEETGLTYRQQHKAIKELEEAKYLETKLMGVPAKKYFCITDKIFNDLHLTEGKASSDKKSKLNESKDERDSTNCSSIDKKSKQEMTKCITKIGQKGPTIKKKKEKEQYKENKELLVNKRDEIVNKLWKHFSFEGMNKELFFRVLTQIESQEAEGNRIDDFERYFSAALHTALNRADIKRGLKEPPRITMPGLPDYDWLNADLE